MTNTKIRKIKLILQLFRDYWVRYMPSSIAQLIVGKCDYAFLAHLLEEKDLIRKYPFMKSFSQKTLKRICKYLWPIVGSEISGFEKRGGRKTKGWVMVCPMTAEQLLNDKNAKKRVRQTVKLAEKLGAKIIGLGAFSSICTHGGSDLIGKFNKIKITSGNTYSAGLIMQNAEKIMKNVGLSINKAVIGVVGAAGSVGSACSYYFCENAHKVILIDKDKAELDALSKNIESKMDKRSIIVNSTSDLNALKEADVVIGVTSSAEGIINEKHLKKGTIVIDAAQPKNVSDSLLNNNKYLVVNSGIAKIPGVRINLDLNLFEDEVYACLGEVLILIWNDWITDYSIGKVDYENVKTLLSKSMEASLTLADFRNERGFLDKKEINRFSVPSIA